MDFFFERTEKSGDVVVTISCFIKCYVMYIDKLSSKRLSKYIDFEKKGKLHKSFLPKKESAERVECPLV